MKQLQDYQIREILRICTNSTDDDMWVPRLILQARHRVSKYEDEFVHLYDAYLDNGNEAYTFEEFVDACERNSEFKSKFEQGQ